MEPKGEKPRLADFLNLEGAWTQTQVLWEAGFYLPGPWCTMGGWPQGLSYWPQTDAFILEQRELSTPTYFSSGKLGHEERSTQIAEFLCKGDFPWLAWEEGGPGSQGLRITSRSQEETQASGQQEKGNLSRTPVGKWVWPKAPQRLEALPSPETGGGSSGGLRLDCEMGQAGARIHLSSSRKDFRFT